ncbi:transporter substrate-binding domain-containing protein [Candidatus Bipolaricaulota bacterium]|nr:transporter substrate-binding domain-containing protein [Candidatus Bipolaricaulota bacterium]
MLILFTFLLLGLSVAVLLQDRLLNAVILLGVFSLLSSVVYFVVGAPDVAVTEGAIGVAFVTFIYVLALSDQGKLHVIAEEVPSFLFQEKGELRGVELEILRDFSEEIDLDLEIEFVDHQELTSLIGGRRADMIAGAYFPGHLPSDGLSDSRSYHQGQLTKIHLSSQEGEEEIGVLREFESEELTELTEEDFASFDSTYFNSLDEMIREYNEGRIDGFVADSGRMSTALYRINSPLREESEIVTIGKVEYGFAVSSGEEELLEQLNDYLLESARSGKIDDLLSDYFR